MARSLKPQKVDEEKHDRTGVVVDIMLDRNTLEFFAVMPGEDGEKVEAKTAREVKEIVQQRMTAVANLTWVPVIVVSGIHGSSGFMNRDDGLKIEFKRGELAEVTPGGRLLWSDWKYRTSDDGDKLKWSSKFFVYRAPGPLTLPLNEGRELVEMAGTSSERKRWHDGQKQTVLPYREETWIALENIRILLARAREEIVRLVTTDDGREQMQLRGAAALSRLLPATSTADE